MREMMRAIRLWIRCAISAMTAVSWLATAPPGNATPGRIVSINACTDQLLLALADRDQILALTNYARDPRMSFYADRAEGINAIRGTAEEVMKLKPDLVLAGSFTRRATREQLAAQGLQIATFSPARSIEDVRKQIAEAAYLLGQDGRGRALIAELDAAFADLDGSSRIPLRALQLQRRAFASGSGTLIDDIMQRLGITNAGTDIGIKNVGRASLEAVLKAKPDLLILDSANPGAADQGTALLAHPGLEDFVPPQRRVVIPLNQLVCGGPGVVLAARTLRRAVDKIAVQE